MAIKQFYLSTLRSSFAKTWKKGSFCVVHVEHDAWIGCVAIARLRLFAVHNSFFMDCH
jgi:hypothetical protein